MNTYLRQTLENVIFRRSEREVIRYIKENIGAEFKAFEDSVGNLIIRRRAEIGKSAKPVVVFCAHLDTIYDYRDGDAKFFHDEKGDIYFSDAGIGGDDKCGIAIALSLLQLVANSKVILFTREESGGIGSREIDEKHFKNIELCFGIDRRGGSDIVTNIGTRAIYNIPARLFPLAKFAKKFGYKKTWGSFSDVLHISRRFGVQCVNVSAGYYKPHTRGEYIRFQDVIRARNLIYYICARWF